MGDCPHDQTRTGPDGWTTCLQCWERSAWWLGIRRWRPAWAPRQVEAIGAFTGETFHGPMTHPVYPPPPVDYRAPRLEGGRTLRNAAGWVGMRPSELSDLEMGRAVLDDRQAARLVELLREDPHDE